MTEKSFINTVKAAANRTQMVFLQKFHHLRQELAADPRGGFFWWLQTHSQKLAMEQALEALRQDSRKPEFQLDQVSKILLQFKLKDDYAGQIQWYEDAHIQLINCHKKLDKASILTQDLIKPALTELRFISEADQFHQNFQLQPLQRRVRDMYEDILERMDVLLEDTKNKKQEHKTELDVREQEAKLKLAAELTRQNEIKLKQEEAAAKKIETERALLDQQRDAEEEAWKRESSERQLRLQEEQQKHQMDLQKSFGSLQLEDNNAVTAEQHIEALLRQINNNELDRSNPQTKERLQILLQAIAGL